MNFKIILLSLFSVSIFFVSCDKGLINKDKGELIDHSLCKYDKLLLTDNTESCIEYSYNDSENTLNLKHINTAFNCCPDRLYCDISFSGDTIIVEEFERKQECNCVCLYDMEMEVYEVEKQSYFIKIVEPYVGDQGKLLFEVELNDVPSGSYCVERLNYPWGI